MEQSAKIYVAGHLGLAGSAIVRELQRQGYYNLLLMTKKEIDLRDQRATEALFEREKPVYVFNAAARVGSIYANNTYRAEFIYDNLQIQSNIIHAAWKNNVKKMIFLGSNCAYPCACPQPMKEEYLLTGSLEPTNQPFAVAKIAGIEMCNAYNQQYGTDFIPVIPASLFGPNDNYDTINSHFIPSLIRRCHQAKIRTESSITLFGSGKPRREIIYADDMANACVFIMNRYNTRELINVGTGKDYTVRELAEKVKNIVGFSGEIIPDTSKPDGMAQKLLDTTKINALGWEQRVSLEEGLNKSYVWFCANKNHDVLSVS